MVRKGKKLIGEMLIAKGIIQEDQLEEGLRNAKQSGERIGEALVKLGYVTEEEVLITLSDQLGIPFLKIKNLQIAPEIVAKIPAKFVLHYKSIPVKEEKKYLQIATSDPLDIHTLDDIRMLVGQEIEPVIATNDDISEAIKKYYGIGAATMQQMNDNKTETKDVEMIGGEHTDLDRIGDMAEDASVITFVNQIFAEAFGMRATDIHIEPFEKDLRVRYRIDGLLYEAPVPAAIKRFQAAITSRVKIMSNLNIAERRLPQDGRIELRMTGQSYDLRVSTIPTAYGESISIRILDRSSVLLSLEQLGLGEDGLQKFNILLKKPHGIILVTGPTGSGKTTTLYACLNKINSMDRMIISIEDPIEYELYGVNQIQVQERIELTFARCLRAILRHDPNIILVGEIRDHETAEIAIQTALTGHLVFSTLHTNDAAGAVTRLQDMGIEPFLIASSVEGMIAQRLVRLICENCKKEYTPDPKLAEMVCSGIGDITPVKPSELKLYRGVGCESCRYTGYRGRTAIYEIILLSEKIKSLVMQRADAGQIKQAALSVGMRTLRMDGWVRAINGKTTVDEVLRVTQEEEIID